MIRRFQVFISSTYADLEPARREVSQALLRANCFPSGMELFPPADEEQFNYIKERIQESDYYVIISAGRYGTIHPDTGVSYTEMEYDYAVSIGKPIIRLLHKDPFRLLVGELIEQGDHAISKLRAFRHKLMERRLVNFWTTHDELGKQCVFGLLDAINRHPAPGWVRSGEIASTDDWIRQHLLTRLNAESSQGGKSFDNLPVALVQISSKGAIKNVNEAARGLLGESALIGRHIADLLEASGPGTLINDILERLEEFDSRVFLFRTKETTKEFLVNVSFGRAKETKSTDIIAVLTDVTELRSLEAKLIQSQKLQSIGQLTSGIVHDFKNILSVIFNSCDSALEKTGREDEIWKDLESIRQSANRASALVWQLLAFMRQNSAAVTYADLRLIVSDVIHLLNRLVGSGVKIEVAVCDQAANSLVDRRLIEQVIINLVVNARDAMNGRGKVEIEIKVLELSDGAANFDDVVPPGRYCSVSVADEGVGIDSGILPHIFEPFFTTKEPGEGTGLGLSTSFGIIKQLGGYISAKNRSFRGAEFSFLLPYQQPAEQRAADVEEKVSSGDRLSTVLVVDDDEIGLRSISSHMDALGISHRIATSPLQALQLIQSGLADIGAVLSDYVLPGIDGVDFVEKVRKLRPGIRIAFLSGDDSTASIQRMLSIPGARYVPKPYNREILHRLLLWLAGRSN